MKKFIPKQLIPFKLDIFWSRVAVLIWVLIKLTLVALMTNDSPGGFIYAEF